MHSVRGPMYNTAMAFLDRKKLRIRPLAERESWLRIADIAVTPGTPVPGIPSAEAERIASIAGSIAAARRAGRPVILTFGAHLVKNGLGPLVAAMLEKGWLTHLATNGAGSIHDWEFAFQGKSSESVRANVAAGTFGAWEETGRTINLAVAVGGLAGLGYGASVGKVIVENGLSIPDAGALRTAIAQATQRGAYEEAAAAADLLRVLGDLGLPSGRLSIAHAAGEYSLQAAAWRLGVPFTVHPGIGYDITATHPACSGGAVGRGADRDFLCYAEAVSRLDDGVHLTVGSAIMGPMIFEKALSMANNLALTERGRTVSGHLLVVNDLQDAGGWDWSRGEPAASSPLFYFRPCKTFSRMGGKLLYVQLDNRAFLQALFRALARTTGGAP